MNSMTWRKISDGVPEFEEVKGKKVEFIWSGEIMGASYCDHNNYDLFFKNPSVTHYLIIELPEEELLEYKGKMPKIVEWDSGVHIDWCSEIRIGVYHKEYHSFYASSRAEAIAKWNEFVRSVNHV